MEAVDIEFRGDLAGEGHERETHRERMRASWTLKAGSPMRSADWDAAKTRLHEELVEIGLCGGRARRDRWRRWSMPSAKATLKLVLDSGPPFTFGEVEIAGIETYTEAVVRRAIDLKPGERYSAERLTKLQQRVQEGPWFSSVVIDVPRDPAKHELVPVKLTVTERPRQEVGLAVGYGTDDGARVEVSYRYRDLFDRGFDLQSSLRVSEERSFGYADVYLPPGPVGDEALGHGSLPGQRGRARSSTATSRTCCSSASRSRAIATSSSRSSSSASGLSYQFERANPEGADEQLKRALAPIVAVTWRHVDNVFDPQARRRAQRPVRGGLQGARFRRRLPQGRTCSTSTGSRSAPTTSSCCAWKPAARITDQPRAHPRGLPLPRGRVALQSRLRVREPGRAGGQCGRGRPLPRHRHASSTCTG